MRNMLRRLWAAWKEIAGYVGDFQSRVLLTAFYFTVAVPFGLVARAVDPLHMRGSRRGTGWVRRGAGPVTLERARRQF